MRKAFFFLIISFFLFSTFALAEVDLSFISRKNLKLDESLSSDIEVNHHRPRQILVYHIAPSQGYLANDTVGWMRLFHYYIITRLDFPDMPFNYVVDSSGRIYEAIEGSEGRASYIDGEEGSLIIAYLAESSDFTPSATRGLKNIIESYSHKFGIPKKNVYPVELIITPDSELPTYQLSQGFFRENFLSMINNFEYSDSANLSLSGEIRNLNYERNIVLGETLEVSVLLRNKDTFPWYIDDGFVFLSTIDGEASDFRINQVWDSFSVPVSLDGKTVLPGEEIEVVFELGTEGSLPGNYEESFQFFTLPENRVRGTEFKIEFELDKGDRKIVQIRPTNTGALTVYGCPSYTCEMVAGAISGEKYLVLDEEDAWYKISVDGVEGWVTIHYATLVD